jgi:tetratricopeptide (TPR) repeat protein
MLAPSVSHDSQKENGVAPKSKVSWKLFLGAFIAILIMWSGGFWSAKIIGMSSLEKRSLAEAKVAFGWANFLWPWSPSVELAQAKTCRLSRNFVEAETHLNRCLKLWNGANEDVQIEFLLIRTATGEVDESSWHLMSYVDQNHPRSYEIMEAITAAYLQRLKYGPAYAMLNRMQILAPEKALPYYWRGWVLERMDNPAEAKVNYLQALEVDPSLVQVRLRVGEILLEDNRPDESVPYLEGLYAEFPSRPDIQARLGQLRFLQGRWTEARQLLESALPEMENDSPLLLHLARLDLQEDRPAEAETLLNRILKNEPTDTEAQFSLASALQNLGRLDEAKAALKLYQQKKQSLQIANDMLKDEAQHPSRKPQTAYEIGKVLIEIGRKQLGVYWLEQALDRDPNHGPTHALLAEQYALKGDQARSEIHKKKSLKSEK